MKAKYLDDQIILSSTSITPYVFIGLGILLLLIVLFNIKSFRHDIRNYVAFCGVSIIFFGFAAQKMESSSVLTIDAKERQISVVEKRSLEDSILTVLPFDNFTHIEVLRDLNFGIMPNLATRPRFRVQIVKTEAISSPITLGIYSDEHKLKELINKLRKILAGKLPLYLVSRLDPTENNFFKQFKNLPNVEIVYEYPIVVTPLSTQPHPIVIHIPKNSTLRSEFFEAFEAHQELLRKSLEINDSSSSIAYDSLSALSQQITTLRPESEQGYQQDSLSALADSSQLDTAKVVAFQDSINGGTETTQDTIFIDEIENNIFDFQEESEIELEMFWYDRQNLSLALFFNFLVLFMFVFVHRFMLHMNNANHKYIISSYGFLVFLAIISVSATIRIYFSKYHLLIDKTHINYTTELMGIVSLKSSMPKQGYFTIYNNLELGLNEQMMVFSHEGYVCQTFTVDNQEEMKAKIDEVLHKPAVYMITIDVSSLTAGERLFIEHEIKRVVSEEEL